MKLPARGRQLNGRRPLLALVMVAAVFCALGLAANRGISSRNQALALRSLTMTPAATPEAQRAPSQAPTAAPSPSNTRGPSVTPLPSLTVTPLMAPSSTATFTPTAAATAGPTTTPAPDGVARTLRVPILMYHHIAQPPVGADAVERDLSVSPERFAEHLRFLREQGYTPISLADLAAALEVGQALPERPIVLTFDDGYRDNYEQALPILQQFGMRATFFLLTSALDENNPQYMTWEQAMALDAAGMELGAHGYTHADLRDRSVEFLVWQMLGSKEAIESRTGKPAQFFCYPAGEYDERAVAVLKSARYRGAVAITMGTTHTSAGLFALRRVRVRGAYDAAKLGHLLAWLDAEGDPQ